MPGADAMRDPDSQQDARIVEEAARWLEKIERTIDREEAQALRQWLKCAAHRETLVERCKRWHGPEILAVLGELVPVETLADRVERQYGRMLLAICLGVTGIASATVLIAFSKILPKGDDVLGNPLRAEATVQTAVGERNTVRLPDGGSIVLNTTSQMLLTYEPRSRDVALLAGEAAFDARYDPARPFRVFAGARTFEVQPGDARFVVRRITREQVALTVLEGQVMALESRLPYPASPALLRSGATYGAHLFSASEGGTLGTGWQLTWKLSPQETASRVAWQSGQMIFQNEPLEDALQEVERYTVSRFVFKQPDLRAARINGVFKVGDVDAITAHLRDHLGIRSTRTKARQIVLLRTADQAGNPAQAQSDCLVNYSCRRLDAAAYLRFVHGLTQAY